MSDKSDIDSYGNSVSSVHVLNMNGNFIVQILKCCPNDMGHYN